MFVGVGEGGQAFEVDLLFAALGSSRAPAVARIKIKTFTRFNSTCCKSTSRGRKRANISLPLLVLSGMSQSFIPYFTRLQFVFMYFFAI